ncbi:class I adenylate-forming enzyme family protein [Streptomyces sp. NBS 14/10]|uniref:class I adenylate-forming enzyme family protein n=1 Tax=Streptomyces sp. NBS 14/10 TaxID=1945643 RepID=UPI000B7C9022|nr:class I adenylate-forming enzyme family protein [Streptomyces sp. NBS 14/10]KAK1184739.1 class I adenylate-forming enzyme family protein [Streptomyces sp. NBS 14/10]
MPGVLNQVYTDLLTQHADRLAVADTQRRLTYAELDTAAEEFRTEFDGWWSEAVARGEARPRVVILAANSASYVVAYVGLLRAGALPFLLDPALAPEEVRAVVAGCGIDAVVHDRPLYPGIEPSGSVTSGGYALTRTAPGAGEPMADRPEPLASTEVCRFTSGSTGSPSCIEFSGTAVHNAALSWRDATGLGADDRILCFAGLFNGLAFNTSLLAAFLAGAALWLPSGLPTSGQVIRFLREIRPTRLTGFPALYESLLRRPEPIPELAELKVALSSAAPLKPTTAEELRTRHGLAVCNYYGVAETGPLTFDPFPAPDHGQGRPLPGVEFVFGVFGDGTVATGETGEIRVRSTSMGSRYLNAPGAFEARLDRDGFYATHDLGSLRDGRLHLSGRAGSRLNIGGRKIDSVEVRRVLLASGATEAVVFAVDKRNGDPMLAAVVSGPEGLTEDALRGRCLERLASYKVPERVVVVPEIPTTGVGKPRMSAARELFHKATDSAFTS